MPEDLPSKNALTFEGAKLYLKQDGRGFVLSILVHPNEVPMDLMMAPINTRYTIAMVEMADDGSIVKPRIQSEADKLIASAGMLCKNERFIEWCFKRRFIDGKEEHKAEAYVRDFCGVLSRTEFRTKPSAREQYKILVRLFKDDVGHGRA